MNEETYERVEQTRTEEMPGAGATAFSALISISHRVPVAEVRGEVDLATVPQLLQAIGIAGSRLDGRPILAVDLRETEFLDVTGVSNLVEQAQAMEGLGGELRLVIPEAGPVARVFGLLGIEEILDLHHELDLKPSTDEHSDEQAI